MQVLINELKASDVKIDVKKVADISLCIYIFFSYISEHTILGQGTLLFFVLTNLLLISIHKKFYISIYFAIELLFIAYCVIQNVTGVTVYTTESYKMIETLIISTSVYFSFYNYSLFSRNYNKVLKLFFLSFFYAIIINQLIDIDTFFTYRTGEGYNIFGIKIGGLIAVSVGWISGICLMLSTIIYDSKKNKTWCFIFLLLTLIILASGTRKTLLFIPASFFARFYIVSENKNYAKFVLIVMLISVLTVLGIYLTIIIQPLYMIIGHRIKNVIDFILNNTSINDSSLNTRLDLIDKARYAYSQRPYLGWGLDNFKYIFNKGGYYTHSNYYEILVSGGLIGFIIYYFKYIFIIFSLLKLKKYDLSYETKNKTNVFLLLAILMLILEYWQITYYTRKFMLVWILILVFIQYVKIEYKTKQYQLKGD